MANQIGIKRRINGAAGSPAAAGAAEGELALNFPGAAGTTATPELWAFDGTGWRKVNDGGGIAAFDATSAYKLGDLVIQGNEIYRAPGAITAGPFFAGAWNKITNNVTPSVVGIAAGADQGTVQATWNNDSITVVPGEIAIYTYMGTAYVFTGAAGTPAVGASAGDFTPLGAATPFASAADATTGTDTSNAINSLILRGELARALGPVTAANLLAGKAATATPDATPANDASKLVALGASGKIDPAFLSITGIKFVGGKDVTVADAAPPAAGYKAGDILFVTKAGAVHSDFQGAHITAGATADAGDMLIYDGGAWELIAGEADLKKYLPLAGGIMASGDTTKVTFAPTTKDGTITAIDLGKGALDNAWIDGGLY